MPSLNKVELIGHLGKDAETRVTTNDLDVTSFSIATSEKYTKNNEKVEKTTWHNITAFKQPDFIKELKKGDLVYIEGKIEHREYEKDGVKKYFTNIIPKPFGILVLKQKDSSNSFPEVNNAPNQDTPSQENNEEDDTELPF